jgi:23S rRNA (cytosine1962-C5)-methyltransferase
MLVKKVTLKVDKEKAILNRHPWIFSGAVAHLPQNLCGEILPVYSHHGDLLGSAYFNSKAKIFGRMLSFGSQPPLEAFKNNLELATALRTKFFSSGTTAYRLINGEGDFLPGLIIDRYEKGFVVQISTLGMENLKPYLLDYLIETFQPTFIYEKSLLLSRKEEGMKATEQLLYGKLEEEVSIRENGIKFLVNPVQGQKTGFFLDHREMRAQVKNLSKDKRVLNCFAYTGGFSIYAAAGGATQVDSVDISKVALNLAHKNAELNGVSSCMHFYPKDVFQFLRESSLDYNLIILDPPAFAKHRKDIIPACRGYKDINRIALQKMPSQSLLLTSSCSYYVNEQLFQKVVFQAAVEARRQVRIIGRHRLGIDHPLNIYHPEGDYLKSLWLYVE